VNEYASDQPDPMTLPDHRRREVAISPIEQQTLTHATADLRAGNWSALSLDYFLLHVLRLLREKNRAGHTDTHAPQQPRWLASALCELSSNRQHFQSTRALARLAGRSPEHLSRELRRWTGRTPTDVINEARMTHAARCLIESDDKIISIALDCGIQNLGYFYRLFRDTFGTSPQAYRLHHRSIVGH
jgi:AraC family cel operon transcriptional repressor